MYYLLIFIFVTLLKPLGGLESNRKKLQSKIDGSGTTDVQIGEVPYHVAISSKNEFIGSGSLIGPAWVLTVITQEFT